MTAKARDYLGSCFRHVLRKGVNKYDSKHSGLLTKVLLELFLAMTYLQQFYPEREIGKIQ